MNRRSFGRMVAGAVAAVVAPLGWVRGSEPRKFTVEAVSGDLPRVGDPYPWEHEGCSVCGRLPIGGAAAAIFIGFRGGWVDWACAEERAFHFCKEHQQVVRDHANRLDSAEQEVLDANQTYWARREMQDGINTDNAPRMEIAEIRRFKWWKYPEWNGTIEAGEVSG